MSTRRPPLPPPLTHEGITFVLGATSGGEPSKEILSSIALALSRALPAGDFNVSSSGTLVFTQGDQTSAWRTAGRLEAIDRSTR